MLGSRSVRSNPRIETLGIASARRTRMRARPESAAFSGITLLAPGFTAACARPGAEVPPINKAEIKKGRILLPHLSMSASIMPAPIIDAAAIQSQIYYLVTGQLATLAVTQSEYIWQGLGVAALLTHMARPALTGALQSLQSWASAMPTEDLQAAIA